MQEVKKGVITFYYDQSGRELTKKSDGYYFGYIKVAELNSLEVRSKEMGIIKSFTAL
jgi:hypothetical protein